MSNNETKIQGVQWTILKLTIDLVHNTFDGITALYANGRLSGVYPTGKDGLVYFMQNVMVNKMTILNRVSESTINFNGQAPEQLNDYPESLNTPKYNPVADHQKKETNKDHVAWFVWEDAEGKIVYIGDREYLKSHLNQILDSEATYMNIFTYTKEIAVQRGGVKNTEYSLEKFKTFQDVLNRFESRLHPDYYKHL